MKSPFGNEKVLVPLREQGQKIQFLRYHLVCRGIHDRLSTVPTHRLPVNAGNASEDTLEPHFPLPSAAHLLPRFSLRSQLCETLCGCACSFTSASMVSVIKLCLLYIICAGLSSTIFSTGGQMCAIQNTLSLRASSQTGAAIPWLDVQTRNFGRLPRRLRSSQ